MVVWPADQQFYMDTTEEHEINEVKEKQDLTAARDATRQIDIEEFHRVATRAVTSVPKASISDLQPPPPHV